MARRTAQQPPEMPLHLAVPREEAAAKITDRIERGGELKTRHISTDQELAGVRRAYYTWSEYNEEMLRRIFTSPKIAEEYSPSLGLGADILGAEADLREKIGDLHDDIDKKIRRLASIKERLELIPLAPSVGHAQTKMTAAPGAVTGDRAGSLEYDFLSDIHPAITAVASSRFQAQHYADAVEAALKTVNSAVKDLVLAHGEEERDGADLMNRAFSPSNPIIRLADLRTQSGQDEQKGYMLLFAGAMTGVRNPKAHDNIVIDRPRAVHLLFLASLLMSKIDERKDRA